MAIPAFSMRQLLEAGVHFGHNTRRWNPKMEPFIFGARNNVHIIDLQQTVPMLHRAMQAVRDVAAGGGRVLFVGTKRQAAPYIRQSRDRCGQYYVDHRWLGGMLTNWSTITGSIKRLKNLDEKLVSEEIKALTKREMLQLTRERDRLEQSLGGIKDMSGLPSIIVVIDTNKEQIAVQEAKKLNIPVVAVLDSNSDPANIDYPIPGNDDSLRAIELYCELLWGSVLDGIAYEAAASGADLGAMETPPAEDLSPTEPTADKADDKADDKPAPEAPAADAAPKPAEEKPDAKKAEKSKPAPKKPAAAKAKAPKAAAKKDDGAKEDADAKPAKAKPAADDKAAAKDTKEDAKEDAKAS